MANWSRIFRAALAACLVGGSAMAQQTLPSPDLTQKVNKTGLTYDAARTTIFFAEEFNAIKDRLVDGEASCNAEDYWTSGVERITSDGDLQVRGIYSAGTVGTIPSGYSGIGSFFGYYPGKQSLFGGTWTAASGAGAGLIDANIGTKSFNFGQDNAATGSSVFTFGNDNSASGQGTVVIGSANASTADQTFIFGQTNSDGSSVGVEGSFLIGTSNTVADGIGLVRVLGDFFNPTHDETFFFGKGISGNEMGSVGAGYLHFGANSDVPTLTISPGAGVGTHGKVGIGLGATLPTAWLDVKASTTAAASARIRHGAAPTVPNDGDFWSTTAGLYARINGSTVGPLIDASGAAPAFSAITSGTNTTAAMLVGTGASLGVSGSGTIVATTGDSATSFFGSGTLEDARLSSLVMLENVANVATVGQAIEGTANENQFRIKFNGTQTADGLLAEDSTGLDLFGVRNDGDVVLYDTSGSGYHLILKNTGVTQIFEVRNATDTGYRPIAASEITAADGSTRNALYASASRFMSLYSQNLSSYAHLLLGTSGQFMWDGSSQLGGTGAGDTGIGRSGVAIAKITDGSTGIGALLSSVLVEANTAGSGAPNVLVATESSTVLTNEGTTAENYHTLPAAATGLRYQVIVMDADGLRLTAVGDDTIRILGAASAAAGFVRSLTIGDTATCTAVNATQWICSAVGTWLVDV